MAHWEKFTWCIYCEAESKQYNVDSTDDENAPDCPTNPAHTVDASKSFIVSQCGNHPVWFLEKNAAPTVDDDETEGYELGQCWYYLNGGSPRMWILVDKTEGAAVWKEFAWA